MAAPVNNNILLWEQRSPQAVRDLRIKKIFYAMIYLLNLAGIIALLTHVTMEYSLPSMEEFEFVLPFVGGVVAALLILKLPTFGLSSTNHRNLTNLPLMLAQCFTLLFFGPTAIAKNYIDFNDYANPYEARRIKNDFSQKDMIYLMENYGSRLGNLQKYGYITDEQAAILQKLYNATREDIKAYHYLASLYPEIRESGVYNAELKERLINNRDWKNMSAGIIESLPTPALNEPQPPWYQSVMTWCSRNIV